MDAVNFEFPMLPAPLPSPRLSPHSCLMNQRLNFLLCALARLVGLQDHAEHLCQLLAAPRQLSFRCWVFLKLLQQILHGQRERNHIAPGAVAVPGHMRLLIKDGVAGFLPVLALHGHQDQAGQTGRGAHELDDSDLLLVDPIQAIPCPHVVGIAEGRQAAIPQLGMALRADRQPAVLTEGLAVRMLLATATVLHGDKKGNDMYE